MARNYTNKNGGMDVAQYTIVAELIYGSTLVGYLLRDSNGKEIKKDRKSAMKLISDGKVANAEVVNDSFEELGRVEYIGLKLTDIPKLDISKGNNVSKSDVTVEKNQESVSANKKEIPEKEIRINFADVKRAMRENKIVSVRDRRSSAQGAFRYPDLKVMDLEGACMYVVFRYGKFRVTRVSRESTIDNYSINCTITDMLGRRTIVICSGVSSVVCHMYTVAMIVMAVMQSKETGPMTEISYDNRENDMIWKEYISNGDSVQVEKVEESDINTRNCIEVTANDLVRLQKNYTITQSSLSSLGNLMRYPTANMIMRKDAVMSIKTENGFYEVLKVESGIDGGIGIEVVLGSSIIEEKIAVRDRKSTIGQISLRSFILLCVAAIANTEKIQEVLVENEAEDSTIGYTFEYNRLAR